MKKHATIKNITQVTENNLCTGCGTCISLCSSNAISLSSDEDKGIYLPKVDNSKCIECGICLNVCPGHEVDFKQLNQEIFGKQSSDPIIGNYIQCYIGYSTNQTIRYNCTSGGLVTQILIYALENKLIDGALLTRMKKDNPLEPEPFIARTKDEIYDARGSKYCPVPANLALNGIMDSPEGERFAVVGLPCHVQGIRKAELLNKKLRDRIVLHLGLFCGAPMTFEGTAFILDKYEVELKNVSRLDYRSEGWPGFMKIQSEMENKKLIPREEYGFFHSFGFFIPSRCILCCDQLNELADISLGDAWLPEFKDAIGTSAIVCRNRLGEEFLQRTMDDGKIILRDIEARRISFMETKKVSYSFKSGLASLKGCKLPSYNILLPKIGSTPRYLLLYTCATLPLLYLNTIFSSRRCFKRFIEPLGALEHAALKSGKRLVSMIRFH